MEAARKGVGGKVAVVQVGAAEAATVVAWVQGRGRPG